MQLTHARTARRRTPLAVAALLGALTLLAAACSGQDSADGESDPVPVADEDADTGDVSGDESTDEESTDEESGTGGGTDAAALDELSIALAPILPTFNVYVAQTQGIFEEHGLQVEIQEVFGSPLIAQAVQSGEVELGTRNYDGIVSAIVSGIDFEVVAPVVVYDDTQADAFVMLREDLAEEGLSAIEGETFGVTLGSQQAEAAQQFLIDGGVDVDQVEFIEVSYGDMAAAFESGALGGAHVVEPFITQLEDAELAESMGPHLGYVAERYLINAAFARGEWIAANPDIVERFVDSLTAANELILDDPDALLPLASEWTDTPEEVLSRFYPSRYVVASEIPAEELQAPIDFNVEAGFHDPITFEDVIADQFPLRD